MPAGKGDDCMKQIMREWKTGTLHSGKKGPVVKSQKQAVAIGQSMCYSDCECGGTCEKCKKKQSAMAMGYNETAADLIVEQCYGERSKDELKDACWKGYEAVGTKPGKDGNPVPNCVKKPKKK